MFRGNSQKTFEVTATDYLHDYITNNIKNPYILKQINEALKVVVPQELPHQDHVAAEPEIEEKLKSAIQWIPTLFFLAILFRV